MKAGKAFEIFVKRILMCVGFSEVRSDGLYIYDAAPGQMIQGLGESHNADVLLEPPVQTPFCSLSRLLIECKDYKTKVGYEAMYIYLPRGRRLPARMLPLVTSIPARCERQHPYIYRQPRIPS